MGKAILYDLIHFQRADKVILGDKDFNKVSELQKMIDSPNIIPVEIDVTDKDRLITLMKGVDCVISAVTYQYNYEIASTAVEARVNYCDLGQNIEIVEKEFTLSNKAKEKAITLIPDGGVAPGMVNIIAAHGIRQFDRVNSVKMRVGGLPKYPTPPLNYSVTWSVHGLINEYIEKARILKEGKLTVVDSLSDLEEISFPSPFDGMEAFITSGGASTLPKTYEGVISELNYKTIRYPNHYNIMKAFIDLGFTDDKQVRVNGSTFSPREYLETVLTQKLTSNQNEDIILLRVTIAGRKGKDNVEEVYQLMESYDPDTGLSAMMKTTGFSLAIVAQMIAEGKIKEVGVLKQEEAIPTDHYLSELAKRGINITKEERILSQL